jgi:hypothetical protein
MAEFNDRRSSARESTILGSLWTGLNPVLIARFFPMTQLKEGDGWVQSRDKEEVSASPKFVVDNGYEVHAPITDGSAEWVSNWNSQFEGAGAESKAPALSAMLQSGTLTAPLQAMLGNFGVNLKDTSIGQGLSKVMGRTGATKLNSQQIFSGSPPLKFTLTAHFRALQDPIMEVQQPIQQLKEWTVPQFLADDGLISGAVIQGTNRGVMETIFPSKAPQVIGMRYGDMTYGPLVIESISEPFTNPRTEKGVMQHCAVTMTVATLTALDRRDVQKIYTR